MHQLLRPQSLAETGHRYPYGRYTMSQLPALNRRRIYKCFPRIW
jgi:hypothetical protein